MITVGDPARYLRHREARAAGPWGRAGLQELWPAMLLFGSMGAITWAIRGTDGWGGIDGTIVPGMTWGLLWYYLCCRKGIDARGIPLWLGLGIAVGGELGYGQYVSWIQGRFNVGDRIIPVAPWIGYAWFVICGIGWGATGGVALGWALSGRASLRRWLVRIIVPAGVGYLGWLLVQSCPGWFFPNYSLGIYAGPLDRHLERTVYTNTQNFTVLAWWVGVLVVAALQRDWTTLTISALIGGGFGIGFTLGALWCLGYSYAPKYIDWWKVWELNAGFSLGLLYVVAFYWAIRQVDKAHGASGRPHDAADTQTAPTRSSEWGTSVAAALCVFVILAFTFLETVWWTGVLLALLYVVPVYWGTWQADRARDTRGSAERRRSISLAFSVFLLLFITFHGASLTVGRIVGLYDARAMGQYEWPPARVAVFAPVAILVVGGTLYRLWRILSSSRGARRLSFAQRHLPDRIANLAISMGVIGAVTIWPSKIAVLYAAFAFLAILALSRLNRHLDRIDAQQRSLT